ncbi:MAG: alkaline phosphatase D family protein [Planctomycetes bacterium]|nr:alkaline phosphatase D family protein [Planctomycetota bacterium]
MDQLTVENRSRSARQFPAAEAHFGCHFYAEPFPVRVVDKLDGPLGLGQHALHGHLHIPYRGHGFELFPFLQEFLFDCRKILIDLGFFAGEDGRGRAEREQERRPIHFAIQNGDWLYEEKRDYRPAQWLEQVGIPASEKPPVVEIAPTIVGVWENYKLYLDRAENLRDWHSVMPSFFTFDDHEIVNDVYGSGEVGRRDRRAVFRDIGVRAWYDYLGWSNPIEHQQKIYMGRAAFSEGSDILTDAKADFSGLDLGQAATLHVLWGTADAGMMADSPNPEPGDPNSGVYEIVEVLDNHRLRIRPPAQARGEASYSIGQMSHFKMRVSNAEFFFLDTRTFREMHDVRTPAAKGRTMLGARQKAWLKENMASSDADYFFVISSVNMMIPHVGGTGAPIPTANKDDAWTVFLDEREELIHYWDSLGKPVFVLTGDLHNSFAIKITDRVWEFASGPHNSVNHRPSDEGDRPSTGRYQYGPRPCEIRWSSYCLGDIPRPARLFPHYCVVQINNVFNNPKQIGGERWVAYPQPQVIFQYHDGRTGDLRYAESISLTGESPLIKKSWSKRPAEGR